MEALLFTKLQYLYSSYSAYFYQKKKLYNLLPNWNLDQRKTFYIFENDRANNLNSRLQTFHKVVSIILIRGYKPRRATSEINLGWVFLVRIENMDFNGHGKLKTAGGFR
jgi:hypothetical protein